jgi:UDP-N-acetylmuramoyl-tripeptide--D-alanyl-D-alanine ligase
MSILILILFLLGPLLTILSVLSQVGLWQRKEYRFDRIRAGIMGYDLIGYMWPLIIPAIGLLGAGWIMGLTGFWLIGELVGWLVLILLIFHHALRIRQRGVFKPEFTVKAILVFFSAIILIAIYAAYLLSVDFALALMWATILFATPIGVIGGVLIVNILGNVRKKQIIQKAKKLRNSLAKLKVIGITGSYGKTSTKEYTLHILSSCGLVVAGSIKHRNSELAIARDMLQQLSETVEVYVAEMGAYRSGEIASLVKLTEPDIGAITAIGSQHLALFGSKTLLAKAKWELVEGVHKDGIVVLNADDPTLAKRGNAIRDKHIVWYSLLKPTDVYAKAIIYNSRSISARVYIGGKSSMIKIPLLGSGALQGAVAAAAVAYAYGIPAVKIFKSLGTLPMLDRTMQLRAGVRGADIIDDTYSANEHGVLAAIEHLDRFINKRRIIILNPLLELGGAGQAIHHRLGNAAAQVADVVLVSGTAFKQSLMAGARMAPKSVLIEFIPNPKTLTKRAMRFCQKDSVLLLEGRLPDMVRKYLIVDK